MVVRVVVGQGRAQEGVDKVKGVSRREIMSEGTKCTTHAAIRLSVSIL